MWTYNTELYHHGIKGQRWGVRRFQNEDGSLTAAGKDRYGTSGKKISSKEYFSEKENTRENLIKNDPRQKELRQYEKQMRDLANNYDFDQDDGGGGTTKADQKAGKQYYELSEKHFWLSEQIEADAATQVGKILSEKYGNQQVKKIETVENIKTGAIAVGVMGSLLALPLYFVIHDSRK